MQRYCFAACCLLLLGLLSTSAQAAPLSEEQIKEDPRLQKRVTLLGTHGYYLGELLETVSEQTGVSLTAGDRDSAGGELIYVRLHNIPLGDLVNALWSLVSYKHAYWDWERTGEAGSFQYRLTRPRAAQLFAARLREQIQQGFEDEAVARLKGLHATPEERAALDKTVAASLKDKRLHAGLQAFAESVPPEMWLRVLRDEESVQVPVAQLGEQARAFVQAETELDRKLNPHLNRPEPTLVTFTRKSFESAIVPSLMIYLGTKERRSGYSYVGGTVMENQWRTKLSDLWFLDGDSTTDPALERQVVAPKNYRPEPKSDGPDPVLISSAQRLSQIGRGVSFSFLIRAPINGGDGGAPYGRTVRAALEKLGSLQTKWRNGLLLVCNHNVVLNADEESRTPWSVVKRLITAENAASDGFLPLGELASAARTLNPKQMRALGWQFPVLNGAAVQRDLFALVDRNPDLLTRLQSPSGASMAEVGPALRRAKLPSGVSLEGVSRVRLVVKDQHPPKKPARRVVGFELLDADGKALANSGFFYENRERHAEREAWEKANLETEMAELAAAAPASAPSARRK